VQGAAGLDQGRQREVEASNFKIKDVKSSKSVLRMSHGGNAGSEYFLVENRQRTGFDDHLPAGGLLIWHIDDSQQGNTDETHYQVGVVQADGLKQLEKNVNRGDGGDVYPGTTGNRTFNAASTPSSRTFAGANTWVSVVNISAPGETMTATVAVTKQPKKKAGTNKVAAEKVTANRAPAGKVTAKKVTAKKVTAKKASATADSGNGVSAKKASKSGAKKATKAAAKRTTAGAP